MRVIGAGGRPGKWGEWIEPDGLLVIKGWARDGYTDQDIAKNMGIADSTFSEWKLKFPEIVEALKNGRKPVIVEVEDTFYEKKLKGYFVDEEIMEITEHPNGQKTKHKKVQKRWIPPDTTAMIFYLKCRKPQQYNDKLALSADNEATNGKMDELIEAVKNL